MDSAMGSLLQHLSLLGDGRFDELTKKCGVDMDDLKRFFASYVTEELEPIPNTVVTLELRRCAEWLFDQNGNADTEPLRAIVQFLHDCGDLARSDHSGLKAAR